MKMLRDAMQVRAHEEFLDEAVHYSIECMKNNTAGLS